MEEKTCQHDFRYVGSEKIPSKENILAEMAKVICVKCGQVKNVEVK